MDGELHHQGCLAGEHYHHHQGLVAYGLKVFAHWFLFGDTVQAAKAVADSLIVQSQSVRVATGGLTVVGLDQNGGFVVAHNRTLRRSNG